jgi:hypothetical protein
MTAGSATFIRYAEITSPTSGSDVYGNVNFAAYLVDNDPDSIQWAVRKGTCTAATNTVFGNVDGHSDSATINQSNLANQTFSFTGNMSLMTPGMYCFVYNPVEDVGETNIRETLEFYLVAPPTPTLTPTPTPVPLDDIDQCKKDGWKNFSNSSFKNQGQCVSYIKANEHANKGDKLNK